MAESDKIWLSVSMICGFIRYSVLFSDLRFGRYAETHLFCRWYYLYKPHSKSPSPHPETTIGRSLHLHCCAPKNPQWLLNRSNLLHNSFQVFSIVQLSCTKLCHKQTPYLRNSTVLHACSTTLIVENFLVMIEDTPIFNRWVTNCPSNLYRTRKCSLHVAQNKYISNKIVILSANSGQIFI